MFFLCSQLNSTSPLTEVLLTVRASDVDIQDDNDFEFSILGKGLGYKYFRMVSAASKKRTASINTAQLKLARALDFSNDKTFLFTIKVACYLKFHVSYISILDYDHLNAERLLF